MRNDQEQENTQPGLKDRGLSRQLNVDPFEYGFTRQDILKAREADRKKMDDE